LLSDGSAEILKFNSRICVWWKDIDLLSRGGVNFIYRQAHCESDWPKGRERLRKIFNETLY
ncbi:MAG: hypothetical protein M0Z50_10450, partial [Planctomycetia bacterium]|nr:hypothetical protein [Planctomycetia bacterium]